MNRTYSLTRTPGHFELRRAFERFSRAGQAALGAVVLRERKFDLLAALQKDDPETLSAKERKAVGQMMHDRGAAFMLSAK
jgi:hypothetical protein